MFTDLSGRPKNYIQEKFYEVQESDKVFGDFVSWMDTKDTSRGWARAKLKFPQNLDYYTINKLQFN